MLLADQPEEQADEEKPYEKCEAMTFQEDGADGDGLLKELHIVLPWAVCDSLCQRLNNFSRRVSP